MADGVAADQDARDGRLPLGKTEEGKAVQPSVDTADGGRSGFGADAEDGIEYARNQHAQHQEHHQQALPPPGAEQVPGTEAAAQELREEMEGRVGGAVQERLVPGRILPHLPKSKSGAVQDTFLSCYPSKRHVGGCLAAVGGLLQPFQGHCAIRTILLQIRLAQPVHTVRIAQLGSLLHIALIDGLPLAVPRLPFFIALRGETDGESHEIAVLGKNSQVFFQLLRGNLFFVCLYRIHLHRFQVALLDFGFQTLHILGSHLAGRQNETRQNQDGYGAKQLFHHVNINIYFLSGS